MELLIHKKLAMKLIFYLMAVDDIYSQQEWEQFNAMGKALDPSFNSYREELIRIASGQVKRMKNVSRNIYTAIQACVDSSISNGTASASSDGQSAFSCRRISERFHSAGNFQIH